MKPRAIAAAPERDAALSELSEAKLGALRLRTPELLSTLERSLKRHGQLEPIVGIRSTSRVADVPRREC